MADEPICVEDNLATKLRAFFTKLSDEEIVDMINATMHVNGFYAFHIKHNEAEIDGDAMRVYHVVFEKKDESDVNA